MKTTILLPLLIVLSLVQSGCYTFMEDPEFVELSDSDITVEKTVEMKLYGTIAHQKTVDFAAADGKLFILGEGDLAIYDVAESTSPRLLSGNSSVIRSGASVEYDSSMIYVLDAITTTSAKKLSRVLTFDVTNPAVDPLPKAKDTLDYADYSNLKVKNGHAYLMRSSAIEIVALGDKFSPGTEVSIPNGKFLDYWIVGKYLYASWEGTDFAKATSMRVYSIAMDGALEMVQDMAMSFSVDAMGGSGSYCAIGAEDSLHFYQISATGALIEIATTDDAHWKRQLPPSSSYNFYDIIDLNGIFYVLVNGKLLLFDVTEDSYGLIALSTATGYGSLVIDENDQSKVIYISSSSGVSIFERP